MRTNKKLVIEQIDKKLKPFLLTRGVVVPEKGWIKAIRSALNMTQLQLGKRLNITKQSVSKLEQGEQSGTITLRSLQEVSSAMGLQLVYALIPKDESIDDLLNKKAKVLAKKIVLRTNQNMQLENQGIEQEKINRSIDELALDLKRDVKKSLWD